GSVLIADESNYRIRRVGTDGKISTIAGTGSLGYSGDGGPAVAASIELPTSVKVTSDGSVLINDYWSSEVRKIDTNGMISKLLGIGSQGYSGDGGPAQLAGSNQNVDLAIAKDGTLYISEYESSRIRKIAPTLPGFNNSNITLVSTDGSEIYVFDSL